MIRARATRHRWLLITVAVVFAIATVAAVVHRIRRHHNVVVITPLKYSECLGPNIVAHIRWDLRGTASGQAIFVSAYRVGMQPSVVASGGLVGEMDTGEWVSDGTTLLLSDEKNHVLARRTIETTDCSTAPLWHDAQ